MHAIERRHVGSGIVAAAMSLLWVAPARAQEEPSVQKAPSLPSLSDEGTGQGDDRVQMLEERMAALTERLRLAEEERHKSVSPLTFSGYADLGFFLPRGNGGVGWVRDVGNAQFPQYAGYSWTFLGDILATSVNTRGEVADLGDAPGITRFDSINSDGAPGFLVNEFNLRPQYALSESAILRTSINFVPRSGENFSLGDFVDVDLTELEYKLTRDGKTSVFVGKTLPVFGIEYKERKSDQRFGITPSLMHRYTSGPQLGVKIRSKLFKDWLILAGSVTNNSSTTESFHFYSEIDKNMGKTLNGRVAISVPVGQFLPFVEGDTLEVGVSGEWGPQDRARDDDGKIWFAGLDLQYLGTNYGLKAQIMRGAAPGRADQDVWRLNLRSGGYAEFDWQVLARFGFLLRAGWRDAIVELGTDRIYVTKEMQFVGGARVVFTPHVALKAEYLHNREYGGIDEFDNDMFTSSLVMSF
jgi:hypothetical protein